MYIVAMIVKIIGGLSIFCGFALACVAMLSAEHDSIYNPEEWYSLHALCIGMAFIAAGVILGVVGDSL